MANAGHSSVPGLYPGKVECEQAKNFAKAFLCGQPRKATIATTLLKDRIQQLKS
jgi:pyruvate dehydrogenase (quinone)/pyruvate oxidase